jgi:hypothetical protein
VGAAKASPASCVPRRFISVITASTARHSGSLQGCRAGMAEVNAATPAEMPTATFKV